MPVVSGSSTGWLDLLDKLRDYVTNPANLGSEAWTAKRWQISDPTLSDENELILLGSGLAGLDEIYVGVSGYYNIGSDYFTWRLQGFMGFASGVTFDQQAGAMSHGVVAGQRSPIVPLWDSSMTYWLVANGRRIILCAKVSTRYEIMYIGFLNQYGTSGQYPYPLFIGGSQTGHVNHRWSLDSEEHHAPWMQWNSQTSYKGSGRLRKPDGEWGDLKNDNTTTIGAWPYRKDGYYSIRAPNLVETTCSGKFVLWPVFVYDNDPLNCYGELDGIYWITGYNNSAENVVTISGQDYLVMQDIYRTEKDNYFAIKLS